MRRVVGNVLLVCAAALLAACAGCIVLQIGGSERQYIAATGPWGIEVRTGGGKALVSWRARVAQRPAWAGQVNRYGFRYTRWSDGSGEVGIPLGVLAVVFGGSGIAAIFVARRTRAKRREEGRCPACGYDMRATP